MVEGTLADSPGPVGDLYAGVALVREIGV